MVKKVFFLTESDALPTAEEPPMTGTAAKRLTPLGEQTLDYENSTMTAQITEVHGRLAVITP